MEAGNPVGDNRDGGGGDDRRHRLELLEKALLENLRTRGKRPDWHEYWLAMARLVSTRATCPRKLVGCVIVDPDNLIVMTGYNGAPSGQLHCEEAGCELANIDGKDSCVRVIHAEENAIVRAGLGAKGCRLYTTVIPCYDCAKRIVQAGINEVFYIEYYDSRKTVLTEHFMRAAGVRLVKV